MIHSAIQTPTFKLWMAALKPPMYSVAIIPILVGSAIAFSQTGVFDWRVFTTFTLSGILIIAWLNLSNDVFDSDTGIDVNKPHSVVNLTGNRGLIFWIANGFLLLGFFGIVAIVWWQRDLMVIGLILLCCALGYTYQGPPFRLGYLGLGEFICFLTFGPLAIAAAYYSQAQSFSWTAFWASSLVGLTTSIILFCSHFHQVKDDAAAGKRSPIVRLGTARGARALTGAIASFYGIATVLVVLRILPWPVLGVWGSVPFGWRLSRHVQQYHDQPERVSNSKFLAIHLYVVSGALLSLGLSLPQWLGLGS
jgi:1,4-dihydroxy-2-naphthoate octaprenyltransferase